MRYFEPIASTPAATDNHTLPVRSSKVNDKAVINGLLISNFWLTILLAMNCVITVELTQAAACHHRISKAKTKMPSKTRILSVAIW